MAKPTLSRGMRDFTPLQTAGRNYIFDVIKAAFRKYGFEQIETPAIEELSVLTEKYGEEGDRLLFRILDSGNFLESITDEQLQSRNTRAVSAGIASKGLRYDLTVPLARYVVMNRNELTFPFKRFHIDKVWRADRPQRGRYREFYQCDADIIGSESLLYDAECVLLLDEVLSALRLPAYTIKLNNRKILSGLAEEGGFSDKLIAFTVAIDKLDKIGEEGVVRELGNNGFSETQIHKMQSLFRLQGSNVEKIEKLRSLFPTSETGQKGVEELSSVLDYIGLEPLKGGQISLDFSLARGLDYYTGTIYEVTLDTVQMGSIASGGRYNDLTASFGVKDMPGVGLSFGAERLYDVLAELNLLPEIKTTQVSVLIANMDKSTENQSFGLLRKLHAAGIAAEMYPTPSKMDKQFKYAEKKGIPYMLIASAEEAASEKYQLKSLGSKSQELMSISEIINSLKTNG